MTLPNLLEFLRNLHRCALVWHNILIIEVILYTGLHINNSGLQQFRNSFPMAQHFQI